MRAVSAKALSVLLLSTLLRLQCNNQLREITQGVALGYALLRLQRDNYRHELQNENIQFLHIKLDTLSILP